MYRRLVVLAVAFFGLSSISAIGNDDWSPGRAAGYLDGRLQQWFEWKPAASPQGPCVSCHTGMTYLLARPALRRRLGETEPTRYEHGLLDRLRADVGAKPESYLQDVEVIFAALFLSARDAGKPMHAETRKAFDQLWALQKEQGPANGSWDWLNVNLDPWEHPESAFFGAALAAVAVGNAAPQYLEDAPVALHVESLTAYLRKAAATGRPLHDRLTLLWPSSSEKLQVLTASERESLVAELFAAQQSDGGWTTASLGPWTPHPAAPPDTGSSSYATGLAAYVLQRAGVNPAEPRLERALRWLTARQDRDTGAWPAQSMNKVYPAGSMESFFMQDAATAFASLALLEAGR